MRPHLQKKKRGIKKEMVTKHIHSFNGHLFYLSILNWTFSDICSHKLLDVSSTRGLVRLMAERYDVKSNIKLGGFRSQLQATYIFSHTEEL